MDHVYLSLICQNIENPSLDFTSRKDPPLDLIFKEQKASCGRHLEGPTLESATWEDQIFKLTHEEIEDQEEKNIGPIGLMSH